MSQTALAERINVSFQMVQKYEKGEVNISVERLSRIAAAFEIPVTEFFTGEVTYSLNGRLSLEPFTTEERELIELFRRLRSEKLKKDIITHLRNIVEIEKDK